MKFSLNDIEQLKSALTKIEISESQQDNRYCAKQNALTTIIFCSIIIDYYQKLFQLNRDPEIFNQVQPFIIKRIKQAGALNILLETANFPMAVWLTKAHREVLNVQKLLALPGLQNHEDKLFVYTATLFSEEMYHQLLQHAQGRLNSIARFLQVKDHPWWAFEAALLRQQTELQMTIARQFVEKAFAESDIERILHCTQQQPQLVIDYFASKGFVHYQQFQKNKKFGKKERKAIIKMIFPKLIEQNEKLAKLMVNDYAQLCQECVEKMNGANKIQQLTMIFLQSQNIAELKKLNEQHRDIVQNYLKKAHVNAVSRAEKTAISSLMAPLEDDSGQAKPGRVRGFIKLPKVFGEFN